MASEQDLSITPEDMKLFTTGDCHVLAREISEQTGWPMHLCGEEYSEHVFVLTPTGHAVDIKGVHDLSDPDEDRWRWGCNPEHYEVSFDDLLDCGWRGHLAPHAPQRASELAPCIIEDAERVLDALTTAS